MTYDEIKAAWNAQADEHNQWDNLGEDEKIEWAVKCAFPARVKLPPPLAPDHKGMHMHYNGLLRQVENALVLGEREPMHADFLRQLCGHLKELGERYYAGDMTVVDEFLQLYCIEEEARARLVAQRLPSPDYDPRDVAFTAAPQTTEDQSRAAFEAYYSDNYEHETAIIRNAEGSYIFPGAAFAWLTWQAAVEWANNRRPGQRA